MAVYEVETESGTYQIETGDPESSMPEESQRPSIGQAAEFVGKSFLEGGARTLDFINSYANPGNIGRTPSTGFSDAVRNYIGTPEDAGIAKTPVSDVVRAGIGATAFPGGPVGNAIAGVGGEVAHQMFPDSKIAPFIGAIAPMAAKSAVTSGASWLSSLFSSGAKTEAAKKSAMDLISKISDPEDAALALRAAREADDLTPLAEREAQTYLPKYQRTAEITKQPGLAALEKSVQNTLPEVKQAIPAQDAAREGARQSIFSKINPNPLTDEASGQLIRKGLEANNETFRRKISGYLDPVTKEFTPGLSNEAFIGGEALPTAAAKAVAARELSKFTSDGSRQVTGDFQKLFDRFQALPENVDLQTLQNYRSAFGEYAGAGGPMATTADKMTATVAGTLRRTLDDTINGAVESGALPASQRDAYRGLISTRAEQGSLYGSGVTGDILEKAPFSSATNPRYEMKASEIGSKALNTTEDARQLVTALKGQEPSIEAARSSLLSRLWEKSTNPTTENFLPNSFNRQLRLIEGVDKEILEPSTIKALSQIGDDLSSQVETTGRAFAASRGQSITAESTSMMGMIQEAVKENAKGSIRQAISKIPILGGTLDALVGIVKDPGRRQALVNKELAKFVLEPRYAEALLSKNFTQSAPVLERFGVELKDALRGIGIEASQRDDTEEAPSPLDGIFSKKDTSLNGNSSEDVPSKVFSRPLEASEDMGKQWTGAMLQRAVISQESSDDPNAVGPETPQGTAKGSMQLIDSTGRWLFSRMKDDLKAAGLKADAYDPFNEEQNKYLGTRYLDELLAESNYDPEIALTKYHSGPGRVGKLLEMTGGSTLQDILSVPLEKGGLGPEGRAYARSVLKRYIG